MEANSSAGGSAFGAKGAKGLDRKLANTTTTQASLFHVGDHVVYAPHGIGVIVGHERKGPEGQTVECWAVSFASGLRAFIPVQLAEKALRPLSTRAEALSDLEALRTEGVERDQRFHKERSEERARILKGGSRVEITQLLRRLYAGKAPVSDVDGAAIRSIEDLVLAEISMVLKIPRAELEHEMRERYPLFSKKKR